MLLLALHAVAIAQSIDNGTFDNDLASWQASGSATHDGKQGNDASGSAELDVPISTLTSDPFVVTREEVVWADQGDENELDWTVGSASGNTDADSWADRLVYVSDQCGQTITVTIERTGKEDAVWVDDVALQGPTCPD